MRRQWTVVVVALAGLVGGCGGDAKPVAGAVDVSHVHGMGVDPSDPSRVLIATHAGLAAYRDGSLSKVGDLSTDLMGFSIGSGGRFCEWSPRQRGGRPLSTWPHRVK